jgi:CheY-like chemotaxis protein
MEPLARAEIDPVEDSPSLADRLILVQARRARAAAILARRQARAMSRRALLLRRVARRQQRAFTGVILLLDPDAAPPAGAIGTVLVADDDATVRESLRDILELAHHEVHVAEDGEEALRILADHDIDVLVLDLTMPKVDGWAVLRALRAGAPVVLVHTGNELTPADIRGFFDVRPYGVLAKPVPPPRMLAAVAGAVAQARAAT